MFNDYFCIKVKQHIGEGGEEEDSGVKGYMDLNTFLDKVPNDKRYIL